MSDPQAIRLGLDQPSGTQQLVGFEIDPDDGRCSLEVTKAHLNRHGVMHGGLIATVLDTALGVAASLHADPERGARPFTTITMNVQFLAPIREGRLTATARVTGGGRKTLFLSGEAQDAQGRLIATATGVYKPVPVG